jgi:hypothetical protein
LDDYPIKVWDATGGLLNDIDPLVCGGYDTKQCYIVGRQSDQTVQLLENRHLAASLVLNQSHIWITGGYDFSNRFSSTELVSVGKPTVKGPDLPDSVASHCLIRVNETIVMLIGGIDGTAR